MVPLSRVDTDSRILECWLLTFLHFGVRTQQPNLKMKVVLMRQKKHWRGKLTTRSFGETIFIRGEKQEIDEIWQTAQDEGDVLDLAAKAKKLDKADRRENRKMKVKQAKLNEHEKRKNTFKKMVRKSSI